MPHPGRRPRCRDLGAHRAWVSMLFSELHLSTVRVFGYHAREKSINLSSSDVRNQTSHIHKDSTLYLLYLPLTNLRANVTLPTANCVRTLPLPISHECGIFLKGGERTRRRLYRLCVEVEDLWEGANRGNFSLKGGIVTRWLCPLRTRQRHAGVFSCRAFRQGRRDAGAPSHLHPRSCIGPGADEGSY